ncbi:hypothetical protein [Chromobacterium phragmitis]|uniref:Uncharacterized protein n=1 Tax=Chromobacterium phragmitis TaxID=2202141 RepID=A0ABV0J0G1_9NEIS
MDRQVKEQGKSRFEGAPQNIVALLTELVRVRDENIGYHFSTEAKAIKKSGLKVHTQSVSHLDIVGEEVSKLKSGVREWRGGKLEDYNVSHTQDPNFRFQAIGQKPVVFHYGKHSSSLGQVPKQLKYPAAYYFKGTDSGFNKIHDRPVKPPEDEAERIRLLAERKELLDGITVNDTRARNVEKMGFARGKKVRLLIPPVQTHREFDDRTEDYSIRSKPGNIIANFRAKNAVFVQNPIPSQYIIGHKPASVLKAPKSTHQWIFGKKPRLDGNQPGKHLSQVRAKYEDPFLEIVGRAFGQTKEGAERKEELLRYLNGSAEQPTIVRDVLFTPPPSPSIRK